MPHANGRALFLRRLTVGALATLVLIGTADPAGTPSGEPLALARPGANELTAQPIATQAAIAGEEASIADERVASPTAATFHQSADRPWIDTADREAVVAATDAAFRADTPSMAWTGDHHRCEAGTSSASHRQATITRVNYYRAMAGVAASVTEDVALSSQAQEAAVMMSVQGELSHDPPTSYACFTEVGHQAAANSNLYLGRTGPSAVDGYIEDPGARNVDVGHRTTLLHPPTQRMGVGDVAGADGGSSANVLWVFDDRVFDESTPESGQSETPMREPYRFVAWPPRGYVPGELVHPRWSFTRAGADLSSAEVAVFRLSAPPGQREVPVTVVDRSGGPGHVPLPTLVWELEVDREPAVDTDYLVVITGVRPQLDPGAAPVAATADGAAGHLDPAAGTATAPTAYSYTVRVLGHQPGQALTVTEALDRVS